MNNFNPLKLQTLRRKEKEGTLTPREAKELKALLKMLTASENKMRTAPSENK